MRLEAGGRYELRNGCIVTLDRQATFRCNTCNGKAQAVYTVWQGVCAHGQKCSWQLDGSYAASGERHELDIIRTVVANERPRARSTPETAAPA